MKAALFFESLFIVYQKIPRRISKDRYENLIFISTLPLFHACELEVGRLFVVYMACKTVSIHSKKLSASPAVVFNIQPWNKINKSVVGVE
jgi:hypothetical protein